MINMSTGHILVSWFLECGYKNWTNHSYKLHIIQITLLLSHVVRISNIESTNLVVPSFIKRFWLFGFLCFLLSAFFQVWPIEIDFKFMEPIGKQLMALGKASLNSFICLFSKFSWLENYFVLVFNWVLCYDTVVIIYQNDMNWGYLLSHTHFLIGEYYIRTGFLSQNSDA